MKIKNTMFFSTEDLAKGIVAFSKAARKITPTIEEAGTMFLERIRRGLDKHKKLRYNNK